MATRVGTIDAISAFDEILINVNCVLTIIVKSYLKKKVMLAH